MNQITSAFIQKALFPVQQRRWYPQAPAHLDEMRRLEFADYSELEQKQWSRLRTMLNHSATHSPYYRRLFSEVGIDPEEITSPADFSRIPLLTKSKLKASERDVLAEGGFSGLYSNATGGSTGKPVQFSQDDSYRNWGRASKWFVEGWWGIQPGSRTACLWGADRDLPTLSRMERMHAAIIQEKTCNAFTLTESGLEEYARMLVKWKPELLRGYASALGLFARFLESRPELRIRPRAIESAAETLSPKDRERIETVFEAPVFNFYGSREINNIAAECSHRQGLHINQMNRFVEVVDERGLPVTDGSLGRLLVTDLTNFAMPFIRYELEDVGSWHHGDCPCGRAFPRLASVAGRTSDFIVRPDGRAIHGEYFTHLFYDQKGVERFQLVQKDATHVELKLVLSTPDETAVTTASARVQEALGNDIILTTTQVKEIPTSASGKHRFTVSNVPVAWSGQEPVDRG